MFSNLVKEMKERIAAIRGGGRTTMRKTTKKRTLTTKTKRK